MIIRLAISAAGYLAIGAALCWLLLSYDPVPPPQIPHKHEAVIR